MNGMRRRLNILFFSLDVCVHIWFDDTYAHYENLVHGISGSRESGPSRVTHTKYHAHENSSVSYSVFAIFMTMNCLYFKNHQNPFLLRRGQIF